MPPVVAFGRRWQVGSDDFVFPAFLDLTVKICWLVATVVVYLRNEAYFDCPTGSYYQMYLYGLMSILFVLVLTDALVLKNSMSGHIMDQPARIKVVPFIYIRLFFEVLDISWNIYGTIWAYGYDFRICPDAPEALAFMRRFVICNWISIVVLFSFFIFLWDPLGSKKPSEDEGDQHWNFELGLPHSDRAPYWERRCRMFGCFRCGCNSKRAKDEIVRDSFKEVGKLFGFMFSEENLVATDVAAGLVALYYKSIKMLEKEEKIESSKSSFNNNTPVTCICRNNVLIPITKQPIPHENFPDVIASSNDIVLVDHFLSFIHGCYGWQGFLFNYFRKSGIQRLWKGIKCCGYFQNQETVIEGDNCCLCSTSALKETTKVEDKDIIFVSFKNNVFEPPFYIAVDHKTKSIVVAIRGTLSSQDFVTDFTAWPTPMEIPGLPLTYKAHHGMILGALNVKAKLDQMHILENLKRKHHNYNLVFVGQSSGGGIATILGMMMYFDHPTLKVYAYSPPGGLLTSEAAKFCEKFTTTVTYGDDIVACLTIPAFAQLKSKVIEAINECRTPKYQLLMGYCCLLMKKLPEVEFAKEAPVEITDIDPDIHITPAPSPDESLSIDIQKATIYCPMYLPGRILHITERKRWRDTADGPRWQLKWAEKEDFEEIKISPRMFADHWHYRMEKGLQEFVIANCREGFNALHNL